MLVRAWKSQRMKKQPRSEAHTCLSSVFGIRRSRSTPGEMGDGAVVAVSESCVPGCSGSLA